MVSDGIKTVLLSKLWIVVRLKVNYRAQAASGTLIGEDVFIVIAVLPLAASCATEVLGDQFSQRITWS